jgi:hypothetical protein
MAEVVGVVEASIELGNLALKISKIIDRLHKAHAPEGIGAPLALLRQIFVDTQTGVKTGQIDDGTRATILRLVETCKRKLDILDEILQKEFPTKGQSKGERVVQAVRGVCHEDKVNEIMRFLLDSMLVLLCCRVSSLSWSRGPEGTTSQLQEFLDSTFWHCSRGWTKPSN